MKTQLSNVLVSCAAPGGLSAHAIFTAEDAPHAFARAPSPSTVPPTLEPVRPPSLREGEPRLCAVIVDDDVDAAETFADVLRELGCEALTAYDGVSGTALILARAPGLVLLDIGLPRRSGLDVLRIVRQDQALAGARIVAVSGYGQAADRRRSLEAGFDEHLVKPIDLATIERLVLETPRLHA